MNSQEKRIAKQRVRSQLGYLRRIAPHIVRRALFMRDKKNRFIRDREWRRSLHEMIPSVRSSRWKKNHPGKKIGSKPVPATKKIH